MAAITKKQLIEALAQYPDNIEIAVEVTAQQASATTANHGGFHMVTSAHEETLTKSQREPGAGVERTSRPIVVLSIGGVFQLNN